MFTRIAQVVFLSILALASGSVCAQDADPETQEMRQQLQQIGMSVLQNMTQKGIDPQKFFGDVRQQMQDGTLDMSALQQKLVDEGLIDKETVAQMKTTVENGTLNSIKRKLGVTDAEWTVLLPKLQRVMIDSGDTDNSNPMRSMFAGLMRGQGGKSDLVKGKQELKAAIANPATPAAEIQLKLGAVREAKQKAKDELSAAQKELIELLTVRQEAVLTTLGLL